ncbi:Aspartic proteinase CDR1 [Camellia lanceoleosa]|uniref:Aspartic proteinase CDR1 n=1 Tax=Camellia lanceoleosa TaxID=1840588 RepID=A0ACC0FSE3_9ERIC|nr:Aspartic proteinase CDR1 [Camellia lanceoleosa]
MATIFNSYSGFHLLTFFCFIQLSVLNYPIAAQTNGSSFGGGGFTAELIHRDSPLSPLYNPSTNKLNRLVNSFRRSFSRASHLKQTIKSSTDGIQSQIVYAGGEYIMKLSVGTPPVPFFGIVDTGSDLTWTQCKPCTQCFKQNLPYFDPKHSSTYKELSCRSQFCEFLGSADPSTCTSRDSICQYSTHYGDNSFSIGHLAAETFTFESSTDGRAVPIPIMVFGCGHDDEGTFNETDTGIVGLGGGKLSFVSQLRHSIHGKFSYCLPPLDSSLSKTKLIFGDNAVVSGVGVVSTPITKKSTDTFYYLTLEGIKVGNKSLTYTTPSKANLVDQGNIIIDSGTTLTLLPSELYEKLESELIEVITGNRTSDPLGLFSLCYSNTIDITKLPTITFKFTGTDRELPLLITFLQNGNGPVCLAFVPTDELPIFGNLSQMNLLIGYDIVKSVISFKPTDCTKWN